MTRFWVGAYGADMDGDATGIGVLAGDDGREPTTLADRGTAASAASPSWLVSHPALDIVYAALEREGAVQAFARTGEAALTPLGDPLAVGADLCHLAVDPTGSFLVAACYGDGRIVRVALDAAGRLGASAVADDATDPYAIVDFDQPTGAPIEDAGASASGLLLFDEALGLNAAPAPVPVAEEAPDAPGRVSHAHASAFLPDGRIATTDLGFDLVRIWRPAATGLVLDHEIVLPQGVGPRHMVVHPSGHLHVVTEYSCEVFTLASGPDGRWSVVAATAVAADVQAGLDFPAELSRSKDGATLYAGVRGSNTIAALRVSGVGEAVAPLALVESGVDWPRHHLVHDGMLLVAGQRSGAVGVLELDDRTGAPRGIRHRAVTPTPTCILLAR